MGATVVVHTKRHFMNRSQRSPTNMDLSRTLLSDPLAAPASIILFSFSDLNSHCCLFWDH